MIRWTPVGPARAAAAGVPINAGLGAVTDPTNRIIATSMTTAASGHAQSGALHHGTTGARRHSHTAQPSVAAAISE